MRVELSFGRGAIPVDLPDDWAVTVVRKPPMPVLPDPAAAAREALNAPVGVAPLRDSE